MNASCLLHIPCVGINWSYITTSGPQQQFLGLGCFMWWTMGLQLAWLSTSIKYDKCQNFHGGSTHWLLSFKKKKKKKKFILCSKEIIGVCFDLAKKLPFAIIRRCLSKVFQNVHEWALFGVYPSVWWPWSCFKVTYVSQKHKCKYCLFFCLFFVWCSLNVVWLL